MGALRGLVASRRDTNTGTFTKAREGQKAQIARARSGKTQVSWHRPPRISASRQVVEDGYFATRAGDAAFWAGAKTRTAAETAIADAASDLFMSELAAMAIGHIVRPTPAAASSRITA